MAQGTCSLRIGGVTAYTNSPSRGELEECFMGLWLSNTKYDYMHVSRDKLENACSTI